jgi:hypothetical protein
MKVEVDENTIRIILDTIRKHNIVQSNLIESCEILNKRIDLLQKIVENFSKEMKK